MNEPTGEPAVELRGVYRYFQPGPVAALDGVDLAVRRGERVAVIGPSGCGKSTLLHLVAALDRPSRGSVRVAGAVLGNPRRLAAYRRDHVGIVFQMHNLLPQLTAAQNVEVAMLGTARSRRERRERAVQLLADVDLAGREGRRPTQLSGGERQRVAIARALANDPDLLLADEPTGSLDEQSVNKVLDLLDHMARTRPGTTMIVVTHDLRVAATADRIVEMRQGRIVEPAVPGPPAPGEPPPGDRGDPGDRSGVSALAQGGPASENGVHHRTKGGTA